MRRAGAIGAVTALLALGAAGCGGGVGGTATVVRTVTTAAQAPVQKLILAHRERERPRRERGVRKGGTNGCRAVAEGGRVKTIPLRSEEADCYRVAPRDRILFVNSTGAGPEEGEAKAVEVTLGGYSAYVGIGKSALFPAPVGTYLGLGLHLVDTGSTVQRPSIQVLPEGCSISDTKPGESLCLAAGAPPCHAAELALHTGGGGVGLGTHYGSFRVVNRSGRTCTVAGFPQVRAIDAAGRAIGAPFETDGHTTTMTGSHPRRIALEPGTAATFEMNTGTAANYPHSTCRPRKAVTLEVRIPGAGGPPLSLRSGMEVCASGVNVSVGRIE